MWLHALFWGLVSGGALVIGAFFGYFSNLPNRLVAAIMAFGSGVLISALSLVLMEEAYERGGLDATVIGFLSGAVVFTLANVVLACQGAKHRKRSGKQQPKQGDGGSGTAIAIGSLLDGIPESIVIGLSMVEGSKVSMVAVAAVFLSNIPEGLSSAVGMKKSGRSKTYVFGLWSAIALLTGIASLTGYTVFSQFSENVIGITNAVAAGAILAMLADTMIPEAFEEVHNFSGLITAAGFLLAFSLSKWTA